MKMNYQKFDWKKLLKNILLWIVIIFKLILTISAGILLGIDQAINRVYKQIKDADGYFSNDHAYSETN